MEYSVLLQVTFAVKSFKCDLLYIAWQVQQLIKRYYLTTIHSTNVIIVLWLHKSISNCGTSLRNIQCKEILADSLMQLVIYSIDFPCNEHTIWDELNRIKPDQFKFTAEQT